MKGWKTTTAAILYALAAFVQKAFPEYQGMAEGIQQAAIALGMVGIGHKIDKNS